MSSETSSTQQVIDLFKEYVIPNYNRYPVDLVRGAGSQVWDSEGTEYLDLFPGWGCNLIGHCPKRIVDAVSEQVATLIHVPNSWHMESQGRWAKLLSERSFGGQAFFCNSGAEANEAAIKLARLYGSSGSSKQDSLDEPDAGQNRAGRNHKGRYKIITFEGGFHGRTLATTTATAQPKYQEGLGPLIAGFTYAPFGDLEAVKKRIDDETCAIMVEPIQGEGGIRIPPDDFLPGLRELADQHGLLLIFDEVQAGCGRTGEWFAYQHFGVTPDVITLAKSLCGGIAGGAMLTTKELAPHLRPGMHASTFGGNPIAAVAGIAMIETIEDEDLLANVKTLESLFRERLEDIAGRTDIIREIRTVGMMIGIELTVPGGDFVQKGLEKQLLINCTQGNVLRFLPAMNLSVEQANKGCDLLAEILL